MASPDILTATGTAFVTDVPQSLTPELVDYQGEGRGPCKALAPLLEPLANQETGRRGVRCRSRSARGRRR